MATDKKAQRAQRLADGWKDVLVWLDPDAVKALEYMQGQFPGKTISEHLCAALRARHEAMTGQRTIPVLVKELLERVTALERDAALRDSRIMELELSMEEVEKARSEPENCPIPVFPRRKRTPRTRTDHSAILQAMTAAAKREGAWPNMTAVYRQLQADGVAVHSKYPAFNGFVNSRRAEIMSAAGLVEG